MNAMKYGGAPENKPVLPSFVRIMTNVKISASEPQKPGCLT